MNLKQLYYFKKLAELQHYTKTSSELYISQPSLSYAINSLEEELGTTLFQKQGRNIVLTKHGKEFYSYVASSLDYLDKGINVLKHNTDIATGSVDIGAIPTLTGDYLPEMISKYIKSNPKSNINLYHAVTKEVIEGLKDETFDIGFCSKVENDEGLEFVPILHQALVVITKKDHEFAKHDKINLSALLDYPIITYRENLPIGQVVRNLFHEYHVNPNIIHTFDDETTIGGMVSNDFGIAVCANTPLLKQFDLAMIPINAKADYRVVCMAYSKEQFRTQAVKKFIDFIRSENQYSDFMNSNIDKTSTLPQL